MKKLRSTLLFVFLFHIGFSQADTWNSIETSGFMDADNSVVHELMVFKDTLYACVGNQTSGIAEIWRSGSGNQGDWQQVIYDDTTITVSGIPSISTYNDSLMWIATGNPIMGTKVYRTENGTDWQHISFFNFGPGPIRPSPTPNMVVYQGSADSEPYLYAAANTHGGGSASELWRTPFSSTDPNDWVKIIDFDIKDPNTTQVTYFYVWNDTLYFGSNGDSILYQTGDGTNFVANANAQTEFHPADLLIACFEVYNGKMYATTNNPAIGGKLWRSDDMHSWEEMTSSLPNYNASRDFELHNLDVSNGHLWITSYTDTAVSTGCPVWRTDNTAGDVFVQSNVDGFGNTNIDGENSITIGFKNRQYYGGPNYVDGGQVWRTDEFLSIKDSPDEGLLIYPNPSNGAFTILSPQMGEYEIVNIQGKVIQKGVLNLTSNIQINAESGLYILSCMLENGAFVQQRLIVE